MRGLTRLLAVLAAVVLWAAPVAATTVYTAGTIANEDTGDSTFSIRVRVNPGASSAGGTLSVVFQNPNVAAAAFTSSNQTACITAGSGSTVYNCTSSLFTLTCTGGNSSGGNINLPATNNATVTCTTASNFPSFTTSSVITVCVDVTSADAPYGNNTSPSLGTFVGYNAAARTSSPCSQTTPGVSDSGSTIRYYLGSMVSNAAAAGGVAHLLTLLGVGQ